MFNFLGSALHLSDMGGGDVDLLSFGLVLNRHPEL